MHLLEAQQLFASNTELGHDDECFTRRAYQKVETESQLDYLLVSNHLKGKATVLNKRTWSGTDHFVVAWQPDTLEPVRVKKAKRYSNTGWAPAGESARQEFAERVMKTLMERPELLESYE